LEQPSLEGYDGLDMQKHEWRRRGMYSELRSGNLFGNGQLEDQEIGSLIAWMSLGQKWLSIMYSGGA
jgi:hypothetical protein